LSFLIGVLALQGDVREHSNALRGVGAEVLEVRNAEELSRVDGLVIPGGESTTMSKLIDIFNMRQELENRIESGLPVFGTCAGMIMLASDVLDSASGQKSLGKLNVTVRRNAFGSQLDSFEKDVMFEGIEGPLHVAFIRAPVVESAGTGVEILARLEDSRIVAVRQGNLLATSFHPEITGEPRVHKYFLGIVAEAKV
jgi:5'-phosphate synthase pdxT subunit